MFKWSRLVLTSLLIAILAISFACGDDDDDGGEPTATTQSTATDTGSADTPPPEFTGEIEIPFLTSLTGPGAPPAEAQEVGVKMAVDDINADGGINGLKLVINTTDTTELPPPAINAVRDAAESKVAVLGPNFSAQCEAVFPLAVEFKMPIIGPDCAKLGLAAASRPWAWQLAANFQTLTSTIVEHIADEGFTNTVVVIDTNQDATFGVALKEALPVNGIETLDYIVHDPETTDFASIATRVAGSNPETIASFALEPGALALAAELHRQGVTGQVFTASNVGADYAAAGAENTNGALSVATFSLQDPDPERQAWFQEARDRRGGLDPQLQTGNGYVATWVLAYAMREAGVTGEGDLEQERAAIQEALDALGTVTIPRLNVDITLNTETGTAERDLIIVKVEDGKYVPAD